MQRCRIISDDTANIDTYVTAAQQSFTKDVEALLHSGAKHSLHQRLKGEDFRLLQVQELQSIRQTLKGILNIMRASVNIIAQVFYWRSVC